MAKKMQNAANLDGTDPLDARSVGSIHELSAEKDTFYTTLSLADVEDRSILHSALETADVGMDSVAGESLFIRAIVCQRVKTWNQAGTNSDDKLRVVLIDTEGRLISALSNMLMRGISQFISATVGQGEPFPVRVRLEKLGLKRSFRGYRFVLEGIK